MHRSLAIRAPFTAVNEFSYPIDPVLKKAIIDKDGVVVRRLGRAVDAEQMADNMNMRAAEFFMVEGTAADPNFNSNIHKPYVKYDAARYRK